MNLTTEQKHMIELACEGKNVLVDACIGSGKTTATQALCNTLPTSKRILYLTYNKLLKEDARAKIHNKNVTVTNYHGFAWTILSNNNDRAGVSGMIRKVLDSGYPSPYYDVLIVDEYQDIEEEFSLLIDLVAETNPRIQKIFVGDMEQKIYDKTTLDVLRFINNFLGDHVKMSFTQCFRLSADYARKFAISWDKTINGVNPNQIVRTATYSQVVAYLADKEPGDILCLGMRSGGMSSVLNQLEYRYPKKYNKSTVYASIREGEQLTKPTKDTAIFTTYDASKGLEKKICVIFDFQLSYWMARAYKKDTNPMILRNIMLVAASRGKEEIIFVEKPDSEEGLMPITQIGRLAKTKIEKKMDDYNVSDMFDFKYIEDVEECMHYITAKQIQKPDPTPLKVAETDGLIDLSPCIGIYQEASFFENYDIDSEVDFARKQNKDKAFQLRNVENLESIDKKILALTAFETGQNRYYTQVKTPLLTAEQKNVLHERLRTVFTGNEDVQIDCGLNIKGLKESILGRVDVMRDDKIYELKFCSELRNEHYLQLATYLVACDIKTGILWNVKTNEMYEISVPNETVFLRQVIKTITKRAL